LVWLVGLVGASDLPLDLPVMQAECQNPVQRPFSLGKSAHFSRRKIISEIDERSCQNSLIKCYSHSDNGKLPHKNGKGKGRIGVMRAKQILRRQVCEPGVLATRHIP
jgi:hypothetical protein